MNASLVWKATLFALMASTVACNRVESPAKTASDVAKAREEAARRMASARDAASEDLNDAAGDAAKAQYAVALAKARSDHDIAIQQCEALPGDEQKSCKDKADADMERATASAKEALDRAKM